MHPPRMCRAALLLASIPLSACELREGSADPAGETPAVRDTLLSPNIPHDAALSAPFTLENLQHGFDVFSWQSFVALNWPVLPDGSADTSTVIGAQGDNATVWESYKESYEVFLPDGSKPAPWGSPRQFPAACRNLAAAGTPVFRMTQKVPTELLDEVGQPFKSGPLIAQDSQYVRYAIHLNRDAFDYIVANDLYNAEGQEAVDSVRFPSGDAGTSTVGGIVLKSAWKMLGPDDHPGRFHTSQVLVYTPAEDDPPVQESCALRTVGLVGFHIAHKTAGAPQWIWSTFEQVDNLQVPAGSGLRASFHNPDCKSCPVNTPPPPPWNPDGKAPPSQVTRVIPIDSATHALNREWQARLRAVNPKSVWQYYELVSTQWPTQPGNPLDGPNPTGNPAPQFLANTTLETYSQGRVPNVSSSCIGCHNNATTTTGEFSDFSFLLERARSIRNAQPAKR